MPPLERKVEVKEKKPKKDAAAAGGAEANPGKKNKKAEAQPAAETKGETPAEAAKPAVEGEKPQGQKKEKKPKEKKAEGGDNKKPAKAAPSPPTGPLPSMIDLRVGKVLEGSSWSICRCHRAKQYPPYQSLDTRMPTPSMSKSVCTILDGNT